MKKIFIFTLLNFLFVYGVTASTLHEEYFARKSECIIEINGEQQSFQNAVVTIEDNTYVPLRELCVKTGYAVDWSADEKKISLSNNKSYPFYENVDLSEDGNLSNGMKFQYIGDNDFSYQEQLEQWGVVPVSSAYGEIPTAKMAAEVGKDILGYSENTSATLKVNYDKNEDAWVVYALNQESSHAGLRTVIIKRSDGRIVGKYELR